MRTDRLRYTLCLALSLTAACEKYDFTDEERKEVKTEVARPIAIGEGTASSPYTVEDMLEGNLTGTDGSCWVIGYVVGATYRTISNAEFTASTSYTANVLLAGDSMCTDYRKCLPVELSSTSIKNKFALPHNPQGFRQCATFYGRPARYFNTNGLRNVSAGHWWYGLDIQLIDPHPQEWSDTTILLSAPREKQP